MGSQQVLALFFVMCVSVCLSFGVAHDSGVRSHLRSSGGLFSSGMVSEQAKVQREAFQETMNSNSNMMFNLSVSQFAATDCSGTASFVDVLPSGMNMNIGVCTNFTHFLSYEYGSNAQEAYVLFSLTGGNTLTQSLFFNRQCTGTADQMILYLLNTCTYQGSGSAVYSITPSTFSPLLTLGGTSLPPTIYFGGDCSSSPSSTGCTSELVALAYAASDTTCSGPVVQAVNVFVNSTYLFNSCYSNGVPVNWQSSNGRVTLTYYNSVTCDATAAWQSVSYALQSGSTTTTVCQNMDSAMLLGTAAGAAGGAVLRLNSNNFVLQVRAPATTPTASSTAASRPSPFTLIMLALLALAASLLF